MIFDGTGGERTAETLAPLFGRRRDSTIRARARMYGKVLAWARRRRPLGRTAASPLTTPRVLTYLQDSTEAHGGATVPKAVVYAIALFEKLGGVPEGDA